MKKFYAVQHGDNFDWDIGSSNLQKAKIIANKTKKEYPNEEIRIVRLLSADEENWIAEYTINW